MQAHDFLSDQASIKILTLFSPINACKGKLDHVQKKRKLKLKVFVEKILAA